MPHAYTEDQIVRGKAKGLMLKAERLRLEAGRGKAEG